MPNRRHGGTHTGWTKPVPILHNEIVKFINIIEEIERDFNFFESAERERKIVNEISPIGGFWTDISKCSEGGGVIIDFLIFFIRGIGNKKIHKVKNF